MAFPALPDELWCLIHRHQAALTVQRRWRRWALYGHARRWGRFWIATRAHLGTHWRSLMIYSDVRREWRMEAPSWLFSDEADMACVLGEAQEGLWGRRL